MTTNKTNNTLRLHDGRLLGYAEYGDPEGKPIFFFHGCPGSRLEAQTIDAIAVRLGARIIAIDRPGIGLSDFKRGRTIGEWPDDVIELADALKIDRFAVMGVSGGGPYAAACALKIPQRLTVAAIVSGLGPFDAPGATDGMSRQNRLIFGLARRAPWLVRLPIWLMARGVRRNPDRFISQMTASMPEPDKAVLARPEVKQMFIEDFVEATRSGSRGATWEMALSARSWGFRLEEISMEVHIWQGEEDVNVPPSMGRYQASAISNCRATFCSGEGHLLIRNHIEEILGVLIS